MESFNPTKNFFTTTGWLTFVAMGAAGIGMAAIANPTRTLSFAALGGTLIYYGNTQPNDDDFIDE